MICLFLDTSTEKLRVTLLDNNEILYNKEMITNNDHSSFLVPCISNAFKENNMDFKDLNRIIVTVGPGSFTGTRISITVAKTYGYSFNIPTFGISTLESMIYNYETYDYYVPVIEDKNNKLYFSIFDKNKKRVKEDSYTNIENFYNILNEYDGKVLIISHKGLKYDNYDSMQEIINPVKINENIFINNKEINPHLLKPNYIKRIEVESKL